MNKMINVLVLVLVLFAAPCSVEGIRSEFFMDWESGYPDGSPTLDPAMEPSFSINTQSSVQGCSNSGNEITKCKCGVNGYSPRNCEIYWGISSLHSQTLETVSWARKGNGVLKYYADGRELGLGSSVPSGKYQSNRCELGSIPYRYDAGDDVYFTSSFYLPSQYWDTKTKYSIVITQWKIVSNPHGALRLSNMGDYKLYYAGADGLWPESGEGTYIGQAKPDAWNDIKIYYKKSQGSDGQLRVYLNGEKVFERANQKNMIGRRSDGSGGYVKFGMYTEIRSERVIYYDAVSMYSGHLPSQFANEAAWVAEHLHLPSASLTSPANNAAVASGAAVSLAVDATDPAGSKLGSAGKIAKVEWFVRRGDSPCEIAEAASAPFATTWTPAEDGAYTIFAKATDADGNVATTSDATVYVGNRPPVVSVTSPATGAVLTVGSPTTVRVTATDSDGSIAKVEVFAFKAGSAGAAAATSVGVDTSAPFEVSWTPPEKGGYTLYAVATDAAGKTATSAYVGVVPGAVTSTTALNAADDASLKGKTSDRNSNNNYGSVELYMREPDENDGEQSIIALFKFDGSSLASKSEIREAKLRLYVSATKQSSADFAVWSTTGATSWVEESVTWNNGPRKKDKLAVTRVTSNNNWYEWDVTEYVDAVVKAGGSGLASVSFWVEGWMEGRTDGWTGAATGVEIDSHKRTNSPELRVTGSDTSVPTTSAPAGSTSCPASSTTPDSNPSTPTPPSGTPSSGGGGGTPSSFSFTPKHDASLQQGTPDSFGNWGAVEAKAKPDAAIVGVFKFDASTLVPSGKARGDVKVTSAKLRLYVTLLKPINTAGKFAVWSVKEGSADRDETTVTWNNGPKKNGKLVTVTVENIGTGKWVDFDVTTHVNALVAGGTADLSKVTLWLQGDTGDWETLECHSNREGNANPAKLEVVTSAAAAASSPPPADEKPIMPPPYVKKDESSSTVSSLPGRVIMAALVIAVMSSLS